MLDAHGIEHLINLQVKSGLYWGNIFQKKINRYGVYVTNKETRLEGFV